MTTRERIGRFVWGVAPILGSIYYFVGSQASSVAFAGGAVMGYAVIYGVAEVSKALDG